MGRKCVAVGCNSSMNGKTAIMFHKFPYYDPDRMAKWLELCPPNFNVDKGGRILLCSRHFHRDQYLNMNAKKPKLVHNAVPFKKQNSVSTRKVNVSDEIKTSTLPTRKAVEIPGNQPLLWVPLHQKMKDKTSTFITNKQLEDPLSSDEDYEDNSLVVEVDMEESDEERYSSLAFVEVEMKANDEEPHSLSSSPLECPENPKNDTIRSNFTEDQAVVLQNIHLKLDNEDLQTELNSCRQRLALLERHVHGLSKLVEGCECICNSCMQSTDNCK